MNGREGPLEVERVGVGVYAAELHYLLVVELDLEVLGRLLGDAAAEVQLIDLARLVPDRRLVVQHELDLVGVAGGGERAPLHRRVLDLVAKELTAA